MCKGTDHILINTKSCNACSKCIEVCPKEGWPEVQYAKYQDNQISLPYVQGQAEEHGNCPPEPGIENVLKRSLQVLD